MVQVVIGEQRGEGVRCVFIADMAGVLAFSKSTSSQNGLSNILGTHDRYVRERNFRQRQHILLCRRLCRIPLLGVCVRVCRCFTFVMDAMYVRLLIGFPIYCALVLFSGLGTCK